MTELKAMTAVYCYCFPEIWPLLKQVEQAVPREMYLVSTPVDVINQALAPLFDPPLAMPATPEGRVHLDELHPPLLARIVSRYASLVPGLDGFPHRYPTQGSSEGIREIIHRLPQEGVRVLHLLQGEYEGYQAYAGPQGVGLAIQAHDPESLEPDRMEPGVWFISNPSARDGNIIPNEFIRALCEAGHRVFVDLAYVGSTRPHRFDVSHENIPAVFLSLSKPYGLFRRRIGFTLSRTPLPSLYGNKWFKDDERLLEGLKVIETLGPDPEGETFFSRQYRPVQQGIVAALNEEFDFGLKASDALLLAHLPGEPGPPRGRAQRERLQNYRRGKGYRFCLTPYFEERESLRFRGNPLRTGPTGERNP